ncbi:chaperonin GroEL [Candidatus Similichlamydia epinepheli]|uniref:chaperonin GroEL n=1 Tax=Candidatus Similichlamydia epinepheli TaxID=1903953 RepID=UPI000D37D40F|nr:chaperonin GroEL [Candidatus Similichlamydia epinepheli]
MVEKKIVTFGDDARKSVAEGARILSQIVSVTLGPKGRAVMIGRGNSVVTTKDGVSVAKEIVLKDSLQNVGAQLLREIASQTADLSGDGTTTAVVLGEEILRLGMKAVVAGADVSALKKGLELALDSACNAVREMGSKVETNERLAQVATISANNDPEIGSIIAKAIQEIGKEGVISIGESKSIETNLEVVKGMQFSKGYVSPYFVNDSEKSVCAFSDAFLLLVGKKISGVTGLVKFIERFSEEKGSRPLLIVAEDIESEAIAMLVLNKVKGGLPLCAVKAPDFGDRRTQKLEDLAILTGATVVSSDVGLSLEEVDISVLGRAGKVRVSKDETVVVDGLGDSVRLEERCEQIRMELGNADSSYEREALAERLSKLQDGVAVIHVGAATEAEARERKDRIEDALHATRAALSSGVVAGGGVALIRAVPSLDKLLKEVSHDVAVGVRIIRQACFAPATQIASNCGENGSLISGKIYDSSDPNWGYNGLTNEFGNLFDMAVIDPVAVVVVALSKAVSVASLVLTSGCVVTDANEEAEEDDLAEAAY